MRTMSLILSGCLLALTACKDPPPPDPPLPPLEVPKAIETPEPPTPTAVPPAPSPTAAPPTISAASVVADGAHFQFSLKDSKHVQRLQTTRCAEEAKGDAAKQAACLADVEKAAAGEGIRFEKAGDKLEWVSYGLDDAGKEVTYLRVPIALLDAPADELHFRPAGPVTGKQAAESGFDKLPADEFMTVKALDSKTIVMFAPPPKGPLVFHRL